jgi:biopolymer transport protein TolQ
MKNKIIFFITSCYGIILFAESKGGTAGLAVSTSVWDALFQASFFVQLTLLILIALSVACWGVGWAKYKQFNSLDEANLPFKQKFEKSSSLDQIFEVVDRFPQSSLARLFSAGYIEMKRIAESPLAQATKEGPHSMRLSGLDNIERTLRKQMDFEIASMEERLSWLATTGSTGPFIGLFGTVWGIMASFHKIGQMGSASLAVVAPGISEALIATAIGLFAAIPAVMLYNYYISKIKKQEMLMNNFSIDFLNIVKRNFF